MASSKALQICIESTLDSKANTVTASQTRLCVFTILSFQESRFVNIPAVSDILPIGVCFSLSVVHHFLPHLRHPLQLKLLPVGKRIWDLDTALLVQR